MPRARPSDAEGSLDELCMLTYVATADEGRFKAGDNKLQVLGNELLGDVSFLSYFPGVIILKPDPVAAAPFFTPTNQNRIVSSPVAIAKSRMSTHSRLQPRLPQPRCSSYHMPPGKT